MSTSSAPRADTFGATSGATTSQFSKWTQFFFCQRSYGWSMLTQPGTRLFQGGSLPTETRRRHVTRFPRPQGKMFHFSHAVTAFLTEFGSIKDPLPSKTTMLPLSITPDTAKSRLADRGSLERHSARDVTPTVLFGANIDCQASHILSFHLQGPRIAVLSLSPSTVFIQHVANRNHFSCTGVNCDFSVSTSLIICCNRFAVDGHVANCDCVQIHLIRPPLSTIGVVARSVFSFTGDVKLWRCKRWYTPIFWHTEQTGKFTESQPFTSGTDFGAFRAQRSI